ncbi:BTB And C-terminal Kelch [Mactra antiquata]
MGEDWQSEQNVLTTNQYMLDNEICSDVTLIMGSDQQPVKAHKFMLVSRSHVFYVMFCGQLAETGDTVKILDIEADIMKIFLRFLYTEYVDLTPDTVMALMYTAKKYGVKTLNDNCREYLETEIDSDNVCTILEQAHLFDEPSLVSQCFKTIYSKSTEVLSDPAKDYVNLCHKCLKTLLQSDKMNTNESIIFHACVHWAEEQCRKKSIEVNDYNIRDTLGDILYLIRFPNMNERTFTELVSDRNILTADEKLTVYQHFNRSPRDGEVANTGLKFPSRPRNCSDIFRICRFQDYIGGTFDFWENDNLCDAVSFMASRDIVLVGLALFRPFPNGIIRGNVRVFDESNRCITKRHHLEILQTDQEKTEDIKFKTPITLRQNIWYTITQNMTGAKSYHGVKGQRRVQVDGVTISFRNSPMDKNNTTIEVGQIPSLLYR